MRTIISVLFVSILAGSYAFYSDPTHFKNADNNVLSKQALLFELLQHPHQPGVSIYKPEYSNIVNAFDLEHSYELFRNTDAIKEFYFFYKKGLIPYNELFSIYNDHHRQQAIALFHVFYYAKDWDTFYKTVLWARYNVNPGLFVYALNVAVLHRPDFAGLELPIIYEIFPHYFFSFDVIQRAQLYKQQGFHGVKKVDGVYNLVLYANYSGQYVYSYEDQAVSYFLEDIGLNAYYYYFNLDYPMWMGGQEYNLYKDRRGEYYFYFHQQLLARYYLERLSHDLGYIHEFNWWTPISAYYPNIRTYYGQPYMSREHGHVVDQEGSHYDVEYIYAYEQRLLNAIDSGQFLLANGTYYNFSYPGGIEYLGNLIHGNPDSLNLRYYNYMYYVYKTFGHYFGKYYHYTGEYPSVLYHPQTTLRDPAYWMFLKRVFNFYYKFMTHLQPYTHQEIGFDGVKIESVEVDKLMTYFDYFDADISNAVDIEYYNPEHLSDLRQFGRLSHYNGEDFVIKARQWRLNHLPFKLNINVVSQLATPSVVRIYLGPKYDEYGHLITLNDNRYNFVLLDTFKYDLTAGNNLITRESRQFFMNVKDRTTYYDMYKWLMSASTGQKPWPMDNTEAHSGFPNRLILPMGKKGGQPYQLFIHIAPYHAPQVPQYSTFDASISTGIGSGSRYVDSLPLYYPLDRYIDEYYWYTPNMYYYDVNIYHKTEI
ncbi:larval serum protein 2-like [Sitodiplosis mosellana]|uniref:larval serum protein 2-like n=1 Tax=Sitodiplosis mosellana TaxID=263140 RepID=UPI00244441D0|nr:larval serum protein 2-like [Sitodiplosis mosellana]XP_055316929.1 larval serum protein 2-like [Sitodiplosis mosellana]